MMGRHERRSAPSVAMLTVFAMLMVIPQGALAGGKAKAPAPHGHGGRGGNGEEEIIIPMGGSINLGDLLNGGGGGGGISIPLDPGMMMPPQGGAMGFEETETIGPDGKPHIISEHSFNPEQGMGPMAGKPLTAAQKKQNKMEQKEMRKMAEDMSHMFADGDFFGQPKAKRLRQDEKYQRDLFKDALKAFDDRGGARQGMLNGRPMIDYNDGYHQRWQRPEDGKRKYNGWEAKGNSDVLNNVGIVIASCVILAGLAFVALRYYKTKVKYTPVGEDSGIESQGFRSL